MFASKYGDVFKGDANWRKISRAGRADLQMGRSLDLRAEPALFRRHAEDAGRRSTTSSTRACSALFGDSITTDHISPAGSIKADRPAGQYLTEHRCGRADFNQYGARRGNHEVMMRGTFANIRLKNQLVPGVEGGYTIHYPVRRADDDLRRGDAL